MLQPVSIFCKYLQGSVDFSMVTIKLKDLTDSLHNLIERFLGSLTNHEDSIYLGRINELFEEINERTVFTRRLRDRQVYTQERVVEELAIPMVHKLIQELEDGFHLSPIFQSFSLFNKNLLPDSVGELQDFGNVYIESLTSHYGLMKEDVFLGHRTNALTLCNKHNAVAEFQAFKHQMFMYRQRNPENDLLQMFLDDGSYEKHLPMHVHSGFPLTFNSHQHGLSGEDFQPYELPMHREQEQTGTGHFMCPNENLQIW